MSAPARGEVWLADLNPTRGHEQAGRRPVVVVSHGAFNRGAADLVIVLPVTSRARAVPTHVKVSPKQGCLPMPSAVMCENIRSISKDRLLRRFGMLEASGIRRVDDVLRSLLRLYGPRARSRRRGPDGRLGSLSPERLSHGCACLGCTSKWELALTIRSPYSTELLRSGREPRARRYNFGARRSILRM